jgi:hypothetical protein
MAIALPVVIYLDWGKASWIDQCMDFWWLISARASIAPFGNIGLHLV